MVKFISYIMVAFITMASVVYLQREHPKLLETLLMRFDTLGITPVGAQEKRRIAQIKALSIPYEQKQVLINRTIFMGASVDMAYLALGYPRSTTSEDPDKKNNFSKKNTLIYYFAEDKRPTILEFENDVLQSAYKGSVLDLATSPSSSPSIAFNK